MVAKIVNKANYLVLVSEFHKGITESLLAGALNTFAQLDVPPSAITTMWVPGAFELSVAAAKAAATKKWDAIVCLGCVIQGETPHFEYICQAVSQGLSQISISEKIPVVFGVLTTKTMQQALRRSGHIKEDKPTSSQHSLFEKITVDNKGEDAAAAAVQMVKTLAHIQEVAIP